MGKRWKLFFYKYSHYLIMGILAIFIALSVILSIINDGHAPFILFYLILFVGGLLVGFYLGWYSCRYLNWDYPEKERRRLDGLRKNKMEDNDLENMDIE